MNMRWAATPTTAAKDWLLKTSYLPKLEFGDGNVLTVQLVKSWIARLFITCVSKSRAVAGDEGGGGGCPTLSHIAFLKVGSFC